MTDSQKNTQDDRPWHAAFPEPKAKPAKMSREELHELIEKQGPSSSNFLVVDVRRTDFENGFIKGAINLPAHSFFPTLPSLVPILSKYSKVIFHCQSSSGRGPRCAGWYQDHLDEAGIKTSEAVVLEGGIKAWLEAYKQAKEYTVEL